MKKTLLSLFLLLLTISLFAQNTTVGKSSVLSKEKGINVVSPIEGIWGNKQMLVIDTGDNNGNSDNCEYYYSLNGSEPEISGFAYDGPVLIDLTGEINLKITKISKKNTQKQTIKYTVLQDEAKNTSYKDFISTFIDNGVLNYTSGTQLQIPPELQFSFGGPPDSFIQGMELYISEKSVLTRFIPCTLWNVQNGKKWRFMIKTFPQNATIFSRKDVPFYITDWNYITFTNRDYIYKIDKEYWSLPPENAKIFLDRSISHMISWQSIDYEFGNPIEYFVLPPKPEVTENVSSDGGVVYRFDGDSSYTFSVLTHNETDYQELYTEIGADTFYGDNASGTLDIGIFSNSVYQGKISTSYNIKKRPPAMPVITSTAKSFYSRKPVKVTISGEPNSNLYISTSSPYFLQDSSDIYSPDDSIFTREVKMSAFKKSDYKTINLYFEPQGEGASYFKVRAYSKSDGNKGKISEYSVIIDQYNFYYDESADSSIADGTANRPYTDLKKCVDAINKVDYAKLRVKGPVTIPDYETSLQTNCTIINDGNASLVFSPESKLKVVNSSLVFDDLRVEVLQSAENGVKTTVSKSSSEKPNGALIKLENAEFNINNCQISGQFGKNGTLIDANQSTVNLKNNLISISSDIYCSCVSGVKSKINIRNSIINVNADTSVIFSLNEGDVLIKGNSFKMIGQKGRVAELFGVKGTISDNSFKSELKKITDAAIYFDNKSKIKENNNEQYGF